MDGLLISPGHVGLVGLAAAPGVTGWLPSDLFALSQPGIWLDGSDNSVMWQDAAGTTPVTALGQPVGLILDKRLWGGKTYAQVMAEQPELLPNSFSSATWVINDGLSSISSGTLHLLSNSLTGGAILSPANGSPYNASKAHEVELVVSDFVKGGVRVFTGSGYTSGFTSNGTFKFKVVFPADQNIRVYGVTTDNDLKVRISIKEIPGNHAYQTTSGSRPLWQEDANGARGLKPDGVDDFLVTPSIDFSASDKMLVSAGVRKLSDASSAILAELSAVVDTNNGTFAITAPGNNGVNKFSFSSRGTIFVASPTTDTTYNAPISVVASGLADIGSDICRLRLNGSQISQSTADQGSGAYGNYPLYIGRRGGSSLPFNGFAHQLVVRGGDLPDAATIAQLEAYIAGKSGVSL